MAHVPPVGSFDDLGFLDAYDETAQNRDTSHILGGNPEDATLTQTMDSYNTDAPLWNHWAKQPLDALKTELSRNGLRTDLPVVEKVELVSRLLRHLNMEQTSNQPKFSKLEERSVSLCDIPTECTIMDLDEDYLKRLLISDPKNIKNNLSKKMLVDRVQRKWREYRNYEAESRKSDTSAQASKKRHKCITCSVEDANQIFIPCGHVLNCATCVQDTKLCGACHTSITKRYRIYL